MLFSVIIFFINFLSVRGSRPGKTVQLTESEIRGLCLKSREIFLSQPILLELEAPLKICGKYYFFSFFNFLLIFDFSFLFDTESSYFVFNCFYLISNSRNLLFCDICEFLLICLVCCNLRF